ncbi:MAG: VOC family protein [Actinomycetota bacterium]
MSEVTVHGIDHVVLNVADPERSMRWYRDVLGLLPVDYEGWKAGRAGLLAIRINDTSIIDLVPTDAERTGENMNHLAFWVDGDLDEFLARDDVDVWRRDEGFIGAQGAGPSAQIVDPDGNRIELKQYLPLA